MQPHRPQYKAFKKSFGPSKHPLYLGLSLYIARPSWVILNVLPRLEGRGMALQETILETVGLGKSFKGFLAVSDVNLKVARGAIHALIGPNGAGKTTCFNLLTKFLEPSSGQILFNGLDITSEAPALIARRGIIRSFQISAVFPHLTVLENVRVALQRELGTEFHFWRSGDSLNVLNDRALELLHEVGLEEFAHEQTLNLAYGRKRALEIATTSHGARINALR